MSAWAAMNGFLLLDKARGVRSTACVQHINRLLGKEIKVGHAGTLDSSADGLLVLLIGKATRWADMVMNLPKEYFVTAAFGKTTDTDDASGEITSENDISHLSERRIDCACASFLGWRAQMPPRISAVKIKGVAAHAVTRSGGIPDTKPRPVFIRSVRRRTSLLEGGLAGFSVCCGRGTYVRSIIRDMGNILECGAHVLRLRRSSIGSLHVDTAVSQEDFEHLSAADVSNLLLPVESVLDAYTWYDITSAQSETLLQGKSVPIACVRAFRYGRIPSERGILLATRNHVAFCTMSLSGTTLLAVPERNMTSVGERDA